MHVISSLKCRRAVWLVTACAAGSAIIYVVWFAFAYPLLSLYEQPLLDLGKLTDHDPSGAIAFFAPVTLLFILYWIGYRAMAPALALARWMRWVIIGAPLLFLAALVLTFPIGAIDLYDYTFQTRLFALYDVSPIAHVAAEFPNDPLLKYIAWPTTPSPYGPLWQGLAVFEYGLARGDLLGNLIGFKLIAAASLLADAALAAMIVRRIRPAAAWAAFYFVAWNPLLLFETAANGHNDGLMLTFILIGIALFQRRRLTIAAVAIMLAALIKLPAVAALPALGMAALQGLPGWRARIDWMLRTGIACVLVTLLLYAPLAAKGMFSNIGAHNELFTSSLPAISLLILKTGMEDAEARDLVQRAALAICAALLAWRWLRSGESIDAPANDIFDALLLLLGLATFWFQPWYVLWILPLAPLVSAKRRAFVMILSWSVLGIYFVFDFWLWWDIPFFIRDGGLPMNLAAVGLAFGPPAALLGWYSIRNISRGMRGATGVSNMNRQRGAESA